MKETREATKHGAILYDESLGLHVHPDLFDTSFWQSQGAELSQGEQRRGRVLFIRRGQHRWVLKHYYRGGLAARISNDRYLWTGEARVRSFREWRLLARLYKQGLPVPRPIAAIYHRGAGTYTSDLISAQIRGARALSEALRDHTAGEMPWLAIGRTLKRFHLAGACHPDLNAHNILLDTKGAVHLLDFDKGRIRRQGPWCMANLARLQRSLHKIDEDHSVSYGRQGWAELLEAYKQAGRK
jgi:3-deoxy-D-manno-octulosonic acid kinase